MVVKNNFAYCPPRARASTALEHRPGLLGNNIDYLNYATGIGIRPRTAVTMCVAFFRFYVDAISGVTFGDSVFDIQVRPALYRIRSSKTAFLTIAEDFYPLDSFIAILRKLAT